MSSVTTSGGRPQPSRPSASPLNRRLFEAPTCAVGRFRCGVDDARFTDSGPAGGTLFVFPGTPVTIEHEGQAAVVADRNAVMFYNRGQRYRRGALSPAGDRCTWFAVDDALVVDAVAAFDPRVAERPDRPFDVSRGSSSPALYLRHHRLASLLAAVSDAGSGPVTVEAADIEAAVLELLHDVVAHAYACRGVRPQGAPGTRRRRAALVEDAKALLARRLDEPLRLDRVASDLGASPFHLARVFRAATGATVHGYLTQLRLRAGLERVAAGDELADVALAVGFSSHSHFSAAFRRAFGVTPSQARARDALQT